MAGEYSPEVLHKGLRAFFAEHQPGWLPPAPPKTIPIQPMTVHARPPGLCTGCPERPVFAALKLVQRELGEHHVSADIGCHLFSILPPFHIGNTTMGYGLGAAGAAAFNTPSSQTRHQHHGRRRLLAQRADQRHRQRGVQQEQQPDADRRQQLHRRHRRAGHPVVARRQPHAQHLAPDREGGARRRRRMGAHHPPHLRRGRHAHRDPRGTDHQATRAEGHRRAERMHAQSPAPREAAGEEGHRRRPAPCARALRRGQRHLHRRPFLHPHQRLPVA